MRVCWSAGAGKLYLATGEGSDQLKSGLCSFTTSVVNSKVWVDLLIVTITL